MEYELTEQLIAEMFDADTVYPVSNLKPNSKTPSLFMLTAGNDQMAISIQNFTTKGDSTKQMKKGDKFAQVILLSLSEKGSLAELKGGLGADPIGVINTVTETVLSIIKENNMDGVLFRFPAKKMKGKEKTINRILSRVVQKRSGGQFTVLEEMAHFTAKYSYFVVYRKAKGFTSIKEMGIDTEQFTITKQAVGEVVIDKATNKEVTKAEAVAMSIGIKAEKHAAQATATAKRNKIDKIELIKSYRTMAVDSYEDDHSEMFKKAKPKSGPTYNIGKDGVVAMTEEELMRLLDDDVNDGIAPAGVWTEETIETTKDTIRKFLVKGKLKANAKDISRAINVINKSPLSNHIKTRLSSYVLRDSGEAIMKQYNQMSIDNGVDQKLSAAQYSALQNYCGAGYTSINAVFVKNKKPDSDTEQCIKNIDKAFEQHGQTLPPNTTLYRGMRLNYAVGTNVLANKAFYFRNYVSTSLTLIIFDSGSWGDRAAAKNLVNLKSNIDDVTLAGTRTTFAFVVNPGDCPCLMPGKISPHEDECEVLLPRGTIFEFNAVTQGTESTILISCDAKHETQIEEGTELYDGDALIAEGVVKPLSFSGFLTESKSSEITKAQLNVLLPFVSMDDVSEKFIE